MNVTKRTAVPFTAFVSKRVAICLAVIVLLLSANIGVGAQCLQGSFHPGRVFKTTGIPTLDAQFNEEGNMIHLVFDVTPNIFIFDDGRAPNAYASEEDTAPGFSGTVYFGVSLLRSELWSMNKGGYAVAGIMAHEFAHILQFDKESELSGKARELHADFMAGYYLGKKSYFAPTNVRAFAVSLFEKGDYAFRSPSHHGTPQERVNAMVAGVQSANLDLDDAYETGERFVSGNQGTTEEHRTAAKESEVKETPQEVSFTIKVAPLSPGHYPTEITVYLDAAEVGQLSNTEEPYELKVEDVSLGRHTYKVSATLYGTNGYGLPVPLRTLTGSGTIVAHEGDVYQVRGDQTSARLLKVE